MANNRSISGSGLYSLRGGQIQPVQGPTPGINMPAPPMMAAPPPTQQQGGINVGELLSGLVSLYGATKTGQQGIGQQGIGQQQGYGNLFNMLKGLFSGKDVGTGTVPSGTVPSGNIQPGVNYSTLGRSYGM